MSCDPITYTTPTGEFCVPYFEGDLQLPDDIDPVDFQSDGTAPKLKPTLQGVTLQMDEPLDFGFGNPDTVQIVGETATLDSVIAGLEYDSSLASYNYGYIPGERIDLGRFITDDVYAITLGYQAGNDIARTTENPADPIPAIIGALTALTASNLLEVGLQRDEPNTILSILSSNSFPIGDGSYSIRFEGIEISSFSLDAIPEQETTEQIPEEDKGKRGKRKKRK